MSDQLTDASARELENHLRGLFKTARKIPDTGMCETPVIGGVFLPYAPEMISTLLPRVCAALCAREHFRQTAPAWAPPLPLRDNDCEDLINADNTRMNLVGYYGSSLRYTDWDREHPPLAVFASGLLAYEYTPDQLRSDRTLRREFPPRRLEGLCDEKLYWRSPETLAQDRHMEALGAALDARSQAGRS